MNNISKLALSTEELQLVSDSKWILTKRIILIKVDELLGELSEKQKLIVENHLSVIPVTAVANNGKISKGENYMGLPYLILDYPRCFGGKDIFVVRTMFWWANFFSVTLLLSGVYKEEYVQALISGYRELANADFYIGTNEDPWHHHFEEDNYIAINTISKETMMKILDRNEHLKLAVKFSLRQWDEMPVLLENTFEQLIKLLSLK